MDTKSLAILVAIMTSLLFGCEESPPGQAAQSAPAAAPPAATTPASVPAGDPSLPSAEESARKPKSDTEVTAESELTRAERDKAMPLPGQANDHSNPEFAKRGDDRTPAKSAN